MTAASLCSRADQLSADELESRNESSLLLADHIRVIPLRARCAREESLCHLSLAAESRQLTGVGEGPGQNVEADLLIGG